MTDTYDKKKLWERICGNFFLRVLDSVGKNIMFAWGKFIDMRFSTESISSNKVVALTVHVDWFVDVNVAYPEEKGNARTLGAYIVDEVTQSFKETGLLNRICHVKFAY